MQYFTHTLPFFITLRWLDVIDIVLVALIMYQLYNLVKGTVAIRIFLGILTLYLFWKLVEAFQMELLSEILGQFIGVGVLALFIVFQQEIRRFLIAIGSNAFGSGASKTSFFKRVRFSSKKNKTNADAIITSCKNMSATKTGALIVVSKNSELKYYTEKATPINAIVTSQLIESIFFKNSPLHDGGIVIFNNTIIAAQCIFPLTNKAELPNHYGLRHRAGLGIIENTNAISIIVSEETGKISFCSNKNDYHNITLKNLSEKLKEYLD